jgi:hypothetical protein
VGWWERCSDSGWRELCTAESSGWERRVVDRMVEREEASRLALELQVSACATHPCCIPTTNHRQPP